MTRAAAPVLRRTCACGGTPGPTGECEACRKKRLGLQRKASAAGPVVAPPIVHDVLASAGRPLDAGVRAEMEPRFGHSFADVRVHADRRAADSAHAVSARAYTVGRDLVFAAGRYAPESSDGKRLIAHELAHVVQQRGASASLQPKLEIGPADDPAEREADAAADAALRGAPALASPHGAAAGGGAVLRRTVNATILSDPLPNAGACVIHLHGNEANARETAITLRQTHCVNLVRLDVPSTAREVRVEAAVPAHKVGKKKVKAKTVHCDADPNRIFTPAGIRQHAFPSACQSADPVARTELEKELTDFRNKLGLAIGKCRGGSGDLTGPLPVVAMHNNTPGALSIGSYDPGGSEAGAVEHNPNRVGGTGAPTGTPARPNPFHAPGQDPDDFLLATETADYDFLRGHGRNVVLQARTGPLPLPPGAAPGTAPTMSPSPTDDGSLSVALAGARYINVESEGKKFRGRTTHAFVQSRTQALEALQSYGVGPQPCPAPTAAPATTTGTAPATTTGTAATTTTTAAAGTGPGTPGGTPDAATATAGQTTVGPRSFDPRAAGMPTLKARETPRPTTVPAACWFDSQADLDKRKNDWATAIGKMTIAEVMMWIVGLNAPPAAVTSEVNQHGDCLKDRLAAVSNPKLGAAAVKTPKTAFVQSPYRGYRDQETIWETKFAFTRTKKWDRVSARAVAACPTLKLGDKWDITSKEQKKCWNTVLDEDQRQQEILEASSAPGISRHHWGTDVDVLDPDMDPDRWKAGSKAARAFDDAYAWLAPNAGSYGFIQAYTPMQAGGAGFMEERWHWSYYPVAQALLEFARAHQADIEAELTTQWQGRPQYSFVQKHWREYMFNVNQAGVF